MVELATYDDAIVHTLRSGAIRSAILIDDSFPRYVDLAANAGDANAIRTQFKDFDAAIELYKFLNDQKILCDIENTIDQLDDHFIEKIRKSDLVVLDWNLTRGDDNDHEKANHVLAGLADSPQFNLVVIYTRQKDLDKIWTAAAMNLHGGWRNRTEFLEGREDLPGNIETILEQLNNDAHVEEFVTDDHIAGYLRLGMKGAKKCIAEMATSLTEAGCPQKYHHVLSEAVIQGVILRRNSGSGGTTVRQIAGEPKGEYPYLLSGSVFVAFKTKPEAGADDPKSIFDTLDGALKRWRPNLIQLLVSELQNELELHSYAFHSELLPSDARKAAWIYHTLHELKLGAKNKQPESVVLDDVLSSLNIRLIEALQANISAMMTDENSNLVQYGRRSTLLALADKPRNRNDAALAADAIEIAGVKSLAHHDVLHSLNEYLSSDRFVGSHITTGTLLCDAEMASWFLCVSPSCDMVPRRSTDKYSWHHELYPTRPVNLLRLETATPAVALAEAERGVQIFATVDGKAKYLRAVHAKTRLPRPATFFLDDSAPSKGSLNWQSHGFALRHVKPKRKTLAETTLYAVSQLRPGYSARFLNLLGTHQSRVGVDYVNFGAIDPDDV